MSGANTSGAKVAITVEDAEVAMLGRRLAGDADRVFSGVSIDSRTVKPGDLFFCVKGDRFDAHAFAAGAVAAGALGIVSEVSRASEVVKAVGGDTPVIAVADVRDALTALARWRRRTMRDLRVVGVTGSVGKTTTKELIAAILEQAAGTGAVLKTEGNLNNDLGVPLTLLRLHANHRFAVIEMGMSALGEIDTLAKLAQPEVAIVTKVAPAHLQQLGSLDMIAKAKGEIFRHLGGDGIAVVPLGDARLARELDAAGVPALRRRTFGAPGVVGGDVSVVSAEPRGEAGTEVTLALPAGTRVNAMLHLVGGHNAENAAGAAAVALALGVAPDVIARGLTSARPAKGRSEHLVIGKVHVIADCYNANPASMAAALDALTSLKAPRAVAVVGDMLELGPESAALHRDIGRKAGALPIDALVCVGPLAREIAAGAREVGMDPHRVMETDDREAAAARAAEVAGVGGWILVKASRGLKLEAVIEALRARIGTAG